MSTHTPGPWNIDGRDIEGPPQKDGSWLIAKIVSDEPTDAANARLIAAAPDLLAALHEINTIVNESASECRKRMGTRLGNIMVAARAAIAKAEGTS